MNRTMNTTMKLWLTLAAVLIGSAAQAQSAGTWSLSVGVNNIKPKVSSGDLSAPSLPGTQIDVKDATAAFATISYMLTDNVALQTFLGGPYRHDIVGAGAVHPAFEATTAQGHRHASAHGHERARYYDSSVSLEGAAFDVDFRG